MDAAVPVDAKNARPPGTWKTAENAVSHSAHTHYCFRERMIENGESTSVAKPSTESDQAQSACTTRWVSLPGSRTSITKRDCRGARDYRSRCLLPTSSEEVP